MSTSLLSSPLTEPLLGSNENDDNGNMPPSSLVDDPFIDENSAASVSSSRIHSGTENSVKRTCSHPFGFAVLVAILPTLLFGINTGILNAPESVIFPDHTVWQWSLTVSAFCFGGLLGAVTSGPSADRYGRRPCLLWILASNAFFGLAHVLAPSVYFLIVARLGVGIAGGAATVVTPLYLAEIAPKDRGGSIGMLTQVSVVVGILVSVLWAVPFCTEERWRLVFLPLPVVSALGVMMERLGFLPESPEWLIRNHGGSRREEARDTLRRFQNFGEEQEEELEAEILLLTPHANATAVDTVSEDQSLLDYMRKPYNRIPVISAVLFPIAQQLSGINAVFYYSTLFFDGAIPDPQTGTVLAFSVNVAATFLALLLIDRFPRKTLLAISAGGMCVSCIPLTLSLHEILPPFATVAAVVVYITFFEIGLGSIPYFLAPELVDPRFVGRVQSVAMASNWTANFGVALLFPVVSAGLGGYAFVPFGFILAGTTAFAVWVLPEGVVGGVVVGRGEAEEEDGEESVPLFPSMIMV